MFSFQLVEGNADQVLSNKGSILLSEKLAIKLFNTTNNIIGQTVKMEHPFFPGTYQISGLFKRVPLNSSLQFDFVLPFKVIYEMIPNWADWRNNNPNTYMTLKQGANVEQFNSKIEHLIDRKSFWEIDKNKHENSVVVKRIQQKLTIYEFRFSNNPVNHKSDINEQYTTKKG